MLSPSFTILRVRGIRIGAHWSWLLVFALVSWSLARNVFPFVYPGLSDNAYLGMAVVSALIFFACILLHELGHAFQAIKEGMKIKDITLWLFGGVARFEGMFPSAGAEFRIAAAGPLVSVVLAAGFVLITWVGGLTGLPVEFRGVSDYLARINLLVVGFNLVPALPLDGGRILRSWLWKRNDNFTRSTVLAARIGKGFAYLLMAVGAIQVFSFSATNGLWLVLMGWFLASAAGAEQNYALVRQVFEGLTVRAIMTPDPAVVSPGMTLDEFVALVQAGGHAFLPVIDDGAVLGVVSVGAAAEVPPESRAVTRVRDIMQEPVIFSASTPVVEAIEVLRLPPEWALVMDGGRLDGIVSLTDVVRALQVRQTVTGVRNGGSSRKSWNVVWAAMAIILPLAAVLYKPPVVIISPATAVDISGDVEIDGVPLTDLSGRYVLVAVSISQPNAVRAAFSYLNSNVRVVPRDRLQPAGMSEAEYFEAQRRIFEESQQAAAAAAAQAVGMEVQMRGSGAQVIDVVEGSPADGELRVGDVIVSANGSPIRLVSDLIAITTVGPAGKRIELTVERGSRTVELEVRNASLEGYNAANLGVGILTFTRDLEVDLPFEVEFKQRNIGGPSAGLIYALVIADMLDPQDVAANRDIAATGTIQLDGRVGPVGSLTEKLRSAEQAGADVLMVPLNEVEQIENLGRSSSVSTLGVDSLNSAMEILRGPA